MKALYIDPSGTVRYNEFPEEPKVCMAYVINSCLYTVCKCHDERKAYERMLQAAKESAIEVSDQVAGKHLSLVGNGIARHTTEQTLKLADEHLHRDTIHPLPEGWSVDVRTLEVFHEGKGYFWERMAVLTHSKEERKALLIEMMKSDEQSGMYDSSWDDTMTVAAGTPPDEQEIKIAELQSRIAELEKANTDMKLSVLNLLVKIGALESRLQSANDYLKSHNMGEF